MAQLVIQSSLQPDFTHFYIGLNSKVISGLFFFFLTYLIFGPKFVKLGKKCFKTHEKLRTAGRVFFEVKTVFGSVVPFQAFDQNMDKSDHISEIAFFGQK